MSDRAYYSPGNEPIHGGKVVRSTGPTLTRYIQTVRYRAEPEDDLWVRAADAEARIKELERDYDAANVWIEKLEARIRELEARLAAADRLADVLEKRDLAWLSDDAAAALTAYQEARDEMH